jgi:hypothetical protein
MYDRQRNPRRRRRHRDHASERAAIDAVLGGGILVAGLRRGCRVRRVANNVEGNDHSVGRCASSDEAGDQCGKGKGERRCKCNGTPCRKALNEVRAQDIHPTREFKAEASTGLCVSALCRQSVRDCGAAPTLRFQRISFNRSGGRHSRVPLSVCTTGRSIRIGCSCITAIRAASESLGSSSPSSS